jgi:hypothetical protein
MKNSENTVNDEIVKDNLESRMLCEIGTICARALRKPPKNRFLGRLG